MPLFRRINFPVSCVFSGSSPATRVLYVLINYHSAALLPTQSCPRLYLPSLIINSPSPYISLWFRLFFTVVFIFVFLHFCSLISVHSFLLSPSLSLCLSAYVYFRIFIPLHPASPFPAHHPSSPHSLPLSALSFTSIHHSCCICSSGSHCSPRRVPSVIHFSLRLFLQVYLHILKDWMYHTSPL